MNGNFGHTQRLLVQDAFGRAKAGCSVVLESNATHAFEGITDENGLISIEPPMSGTCDATVIREKKQWQGRIDLTEGEHVLRLGWKFPRYLIWSALAILFGTWLIFGQIHDSPKIRLIEAETEAPIPHGELSYTNYEGQAICGHGDEEGIVQLYLGSRAIYKTLFQLNDSSNVVGAANGFLPTVSRLDMRTWYWMMDLPLVRDYDTTVTLLAWDVGLIELGKQGPVPGALFTVRDISRPDLPFLEYIADGRGEVEVTLDARHTYEIEARHPGYLTVEKTHPALSFASPDTARFEMIPLLPCSGTREDDGEYSTRTAYDMHEFPTAFCFRVYNDTEYDNIWITNESGETLFQLLPLDGEGLGKSGGYFIYQEALIQTDSRYIFVHTSGDSNWHYEVMCPGQICSPGIHNDSRFPVSLD